LGAHLRAASADAEAVELTGVAFAARDSREAQMRRHVAWLAPLLALGCGPDPVEAARLRALEAAARDAGAAEPSEGGPTAPHASSGAVHRVLADRAVPLVGDRVDAKAGDWLIESDGSAAVISQKGAIVDFGPKGGLDAMVRTDPTVFGSLQPEHLAEPVFRVVDDGRVLEMERRLFDKKATYYAFFFFKKDVLAIESLVTSTGDEPLVFETLGETLGWGNVPTWIEGVGFAGTAGAFSADFVGRESLGLSYAMASDEGKTMARVSALENNGFWDEPYLSERSVTVPAHESSPRRFMSLAWSKTSLGDAALELPSIRRKYSRQLKIGTLPENTFVEIAKCEKDKPAGDLVTRYAWSKDRETISLPDDCHVLRLTKLGYAPGPWKKVDEFDPAALEELLPKAGAIHFRVTEKGSAELMPARVLVRGVRGTKDPSWGDDPDRGAALNTIYSTGEDTFSIPAGHYDVLIQRGFEYDAVARSIDVKDDETVEIEAALERVVDTKGWISADLHVHQAPSPDAPSPLPDRVRSLAASGVEVAVATDHNKVTDYGPTIRQLHLENRMASVVGDEITTKEPALGHYNVFPLRADAFPVLYEKATPAAIFDAARQAGPPGLSPIVQVNHPRMGSIGYFELLRFDKSDIERWRSRTNLSAMNFDTLEVFNGDHYAQINKVEDVMKDWYALLKAGFRPTATGNSDSHKLTYAEAGVPRNFVRVPDDDPAAFDPKAFVEALRAGRVVVSSGPFVRLFADEHEVGDEVAEGELEIEVKVDAAPWVEIDRVELWVNGEPAEGWPVPASTASQRFSKKIKKRFERGDFLVAIARGSKSMTFLHRSGAKPFGFTNPIYVR
jgi:hypothetical protein